jgi:hypothetical protein
MFIYRYIIGISIWERRFVVEMAKDPKIVALVLAELPKLNHPQGKTR